MRKLILFFVLSMAFVFAQSQTAITKVEFSNAGSGKVEMSLVTENLPQVTAVSLKFNVLPYVVYSIDSIDGVPPGTLTNYTNGQFALSWFSLTPVQWDTVKMTLTGHPIMTTTLLWDNSSANNNEYVDAAGNSVLCAFQGTTINFAPLGRLKGHVFYASQPPQGMKDVVVGLEANMLKKTFTVVTDTAGYFDAEIPRDVYTITFDVPLDTNVIKSVNSSDALEVLKHTVALIQLDSLQISAADMDGNGYVNATDAMLVAKHFTHQDNSYQNVYVNDLQTRLPVNGTTVRDFFLLHKGDINRSAILQ